MVQKQDKKKEEKEEEKLLQDLKKDFGEGAIMRLSESPLKNVEVISSGSPSLDLAIGVGGFPRGRMTEIYGGEGTGKTTLALETIAEAQKASGKAAFIDAEHALDPDYAKRNGVNLEDLLLSQPDSGEDALNIVERLAASDLFDLIVIDSVAALIPRAELEGEVGDQQIGLQARMMSQAMRRLPSIILKTKTVVLFLNQIRMRIGMMMFGQPETTPGGKALKHAASVRVELKRIAQIKKGGEVVGSRIKAKIAKNKVAPPFRLAEFDIFYNQGINAGQDLLNLSLKTKVIEKTSAGFLFKGQKLEPTQDKTIDLLNKDQELFRTIFAEIRNRVFAP